MQFDVMQIINEAPISITPFQKEYSNPLAAKLAFRRSKWVYKRTRLAESQNWKCCYCGCSMNESHGKSNSVTVEHVTPKSMGGTDNQENLVAACYKCNNRRGTLNAFDFANGNIYHGKPKSQTRLESKIRKYVKKANTFAKIEFKINQEIDSFDKWFSTLKLCSKGKDLFFKELKEQGNVVLVYASVKDSVRNFSA